MQVSREPDCAVMSIGLIKQKVDSVARSPMPLPTVDVIAIIKQLDQESQANESSNDSYCTLCD